MTSSRDWDVIPRDQHFLNCSMTHAKRLSTSQYKPHPYTVFRLACTSFRKCMGKTVSIYTYIYLSIHTSIYTSIGCSIYEKVSKSRYLTLHISEPFWPRNLHFFVVSCPSQDIPKIFWSVSDFGNMGNEGAENRDFGHFNRFVYYIASKPQ